MTPMFVECCIDRVASGLEAQKGGAQRVELCDNLIDGGTTPSYGMIKNMVKALSIPVNVIIRPRGGDFLFNEDEMQVMISDIEICKELGVDGVVIGCLTKYGTVDKDQTKRLIEVARPMSVTFHRAIDMTVDIYQALEDCIELGIDRILTSGGCNDVYTGRDTLRKMVEQAGDRIVIMGGGGVTEKNVKEIVEYSGIHEVHGTARDYINSGMIYRKQGVFMGGEKKNTQELEFQWKQTSSKIVHEIVHNASM
ncbi:hypothetical protein WA158_001855 [Blastocystis sp. Blastoise]